MVVLALGHSPCKWPACPSPYLYSIMEYTLVPSCLLFEDKASWEVMLYDDAMADANVVCWWRIQHHIFYFSIEVSDSTVLPTWCWVILYHRDSTLHATLPVSELFVLLIMNLIMKMSSVGGQWLQSCIKLHWRQDLKNEEKVKHSYSNFCFSGIEQLSQEVTSLNMCWMGFI